MQSNTSSPEREHKTLTVLQKSPQTDLVVIKQQLSFYKSIFNYNIVDYTSIKQSDLDKVNNENIKLIIENEKF
jgi:hypothetical protein